MANPHWRIWVDWNDNGAWGESSQDYREDITPDVLDLSWRWGMPVDCSRNRRWPAPARLSLTLRNGGMTYTPGSALSPLSGKLAVGRRVWAAFAYPYDDFAPEAGDADGTDLAGRLPSLGDGYQWTKRTTGAAGITLSQGRARPATGWGGAIYTLDLGDPDAHIGFIYRRTGNGVGGAALRVQNQWDYLRLRFGATATLLEDVTFGYPSILRRGDPLLAGRDYFIEIEQHGGSVRVFATDLAGNTADRKTILGGVSTAGNRTATSHGLWHDGTANAAAERWAEFGGWRSFFYGSLTHISPERDGALGQVCRCQARDDLHQLEQMPLFHLVSGRLKTSASIANDILTWSGFSPSHRRLDRGRTLVATEPRALWRISARSALNSLADEEDGRIYVDGRGYLRLESAGHRQAGAHTAARATLRDTGTGGPSFAALDWNDGSDAVENSVAFRYRLAENQGTQEIWRLRDVAVIPAGESRDFLAESVAYDMVDSFILPLATTDYAANSRADGAGEDLKASITVSLPHAAAGAPTNPSGRYRGRGTVVRVANNHATATAYLTLLRLRAHRTHQAPEPTSLWADNAASQTAHGLRDSTVECRFIDHYEAARAGAQSRLARRGLPRPRLTLAIAAGSGDNLAQMVNRTLSDRVKVVSSNPTINGDFYIEGMELIANPRTGELTARWRVEGA